MKTQSTTDNTGAKMTLRQESDASFASCHSVSYKDYDNTVDTERSNSKTSTWNSVLSNLEPTKSNDNTSDAVSYTDFNKKNDDVDDDSDDEFFEAQEEMALSSETMDVNMHSPMIAMDQSDREAEGVLRETEMKLLCSGKPLCVPVTQVSSSNEISLKTFRRLH